MDIDDIMMFRHVFIRKRNRGTSKSEESNAASAFGGISPRKSDLRTRNITDLLPTICTLSSGQFGLPVETMNLGNFNLMYLPSGTFNNSDKYNTVIKVVQH